MTNYLIYVASGSEHVRLSYTERAYWSIPFGETRASPTRVNRTSNWVQSKQSYSPFQFRTPLIVCVMINQYEKSVHSAHTRIENTLRVGNGLFRLNSTADTHTHTHIHKHTHTHRMKLQWISSESDCYLVFGIHAPCIFSGNFRIQ